MNLVQIPVGVETRSSTNKTNVFIVNGTETVLIDPAAATTNLTRVTDKYHVDHVVATHTHPDHIGGMAVYSSKTDATVWVHKDYTSRFVDATTVVPNQTFEDNTQIGPLTVRETPGHAQDHVVFVYEESALVGDLVAPAGSVFVGGSDGDMHEYLRSLRWLLKSGFDLLFPGHGPSISEPGIVVRRILQHRLTREKQIIKAIDRGARTPDDILVRVYTKDLTGVRDLALLTIIAHLEKLADDGVITWDGIQAGFNS